jgi:uncharacterized membrane-anchored protein
MKKTIIIIIFVIFCLSQITVLSYLVYKGNKKGTVIKLKCGLYDPYDFIKGRFLYLKFFMEDQKFTNYPESLKKDIKDSKITYLYCVLSKDFSKIETLSFDKPADTKLFFKVKLGYSYEDYFSVEFPFNKYYIQEDLALKAEPVIRKDFDKLNPILYISIDGEGGTRIEKLELNGIPVEKYITESK